MCQSQHDILLGDSQRITNHQFVLKNRAKYMFGRHQALFLNIILFFELILSNKIICENLFFLNNEVKPPTPFKIYIHIYTYIF